MRETPPTPPALSRRTVLGVAFAAALLPTGTATAAGRTAVGGELLGLSGTQVRRKAGAPALPTTNSQAWVVADADSGEVLAANNAHKPLPPASTLKMLFADTVLPKFDKKRTHKVVDADLAGMGAGSSLVGIERGTTYTVEQLWLGVFLRSGNDAVHVLCAMNGGVDRTVREMRTLAKKLQADDTHVVSPDGYDTAGQVSSAYDLTLFARAGLRNTDFRQYCATEVAEFPAGGGKTFQIQNTDRLLGDYRGLIGVKNGYTTDAGNTFTGAAKRGGRTLLVTVMHPTSGYDEVYREAAALLDWGFGAVDAVEPVGTLVEPLAEAAPSPGASAGGSSQASATRSVTPADPDAVLRTGTAAVLSALIAGCSLALRRRRAPVRVPAGGRRRRA
jgi:D-alanyl-D-alanine carboxypeptidase (penicillin-binding protein 5/6)